MRHVGMLMILVLAASFAGAQEVSVSVSENPAFESAFNNYKTFMLAGDVDKDSTRDHKYQKNKAEMTSVQNDKYDKEHKDKAISGADKGDKRKMSWRGREHHIGREIKSEMEALGYTYAETNPDLIVTYKVLDKPGKVMQFQASSNVATPGPSIEEYETEAGTLMVSIMDREKSEVVWQGFVSGLKDDNDKFTSDERQIRAAAEILFDRFSYRGDDISVREL